MVMKHSLAVKVSFILILLVFSGAFFSLVYAQEKVFTMKFSNFLFAEAKNSILAENWGKEVEKRTDGRVKITVFHGGTLTPGPKVYDGVVNGTSDIGMSVFAYTKAKFPLTQVIDLPIGHKSGYTSTKHM
jgi:TRAP-type C4-dicarboxylate transport system substrate-binding protein